VPCSQTPSSSTHDLLSIGWAGVFYASPLSQPAILPMVTIDPRLLRLADNLRRAFQASGLTKADVARALDVDASVVGRWLTAERTPTVTNLMDLAALLGVEMAELWDGPTAVPATPEQKAMLAQMGRLTPAQQQAMLTMAATLAGVMPENP